MKKNKNPEVEPGDRVMCVKMSEEFSVAPGDLGTVIDVTNDPTLSGVKIIGMKWDNGSTLSLLSDADLWKKVRRDYIDESRTNRFFQSFEKNEDVYEHFDIHYFNDFFRKVRESGVVNMFEAAPFVLAGEQWIERYYGEGREDEEAFQNLLEVADETKYKFISNLMDYMQEKGMSVDDINKVNSTARRVAMVLLSIYITYH